jgi:protein-disulfide isomerase
VSNKQQRQKSQRRRHRAKHSQPDQASGLGNRIWIGVAIAVVAVLAVVGAGLVLSGDDDGGEIRARTMSASGRALGPVDAPVTIEYFEDFQCPACRAFTASVAPRIEDDYVSKGLARVLFRHNPFIGPESMRAAEASECAAEQGLFWEYHDALFAAQGGENSGVFSDEKLTSMAHELGLDVNGFNGCLDDGKHRESIEQELEEAHHRGVTVTPTIFINGRKVEGVRSYDELQRLIDDELEQS